MPLAISITGSDPSGQGVVFVSGNITPSGNYPMGGDTLDFTAVSQDPNFFGVMATIDSSQPPTQLSIWSQNGNLLRQYVPIIGAALNNSKMKVSGSGTFGTELAAGAYPADVTADKITFSATFKKLQ